MDNDQNKHENINNATNNAGFTPFAPVPGMDNNPPQKHSGLGIASFILALLAVITFILAIVVAGTADELINSDPLALEQAFSEESAAMTTAISMIFLIIASAGLTFIGLILGIIGACIKNRKKYLA